MRIVLRPGAAALSDWRAIHAGADVTLDPAGADRVAASAAAVHAILARGEPVYGINTGFGRSSRTVRIAAGDLAQLQRAIVLSHAAGVGEPMPVPVARLMLALKLASLAQGASGAAPATIALLAAMLDRGVIPVVPAQGSVGASGDLAPLAHMAAAMIGVGDATLDGATLPAADALARAGLAPVVLGPKEGLALLNGTQFSTAYALAGLFAAETAAADRAGHRRADHRRGARVRHAVRPAHPRAAPPCRPDRRRRRAARADRGQRHPPVPPGGRRPGAGPVLPALPAAGDGRGAGRAAPGRRTRWRRGERRHRQPADLPRHRRRRCPAATSTPSRWPSPPT